MGTPQRPITSTAPNPPLIGKSRFSTKIKLAQGRGRGEGYLQRAGWGKEGGEGGKEGVILFYKKTSLSTYSPASLHLSKHFKN